ncbi:TPA: ribbon-helix-helix protein, CopG family, partial [Pasteurella multocida]|nr:ribbon-helix-helix protein, CopG family [Pasteurella multocida]
AIKSVKPITLEKTAKTVTKSGKRSQLSVTLPEEVIEKVKEYRFTHRKDSVSAVILEALQAYLK